LSLQQKIDEEQYLAGFSSPSIQRGAPSLTHLGIYATNKRIFITHATIGIELLQVPALLTALTILLSTVFVAIFYTAIYISNFSGYLSLEMLSIGVLIVGILTSYYNDLSPVPIWQLEKRKGRIIQKEQISRMEMTDRGDLLPSKIAIFLKGAEKIAIRFNVQGSFQRARNIFRAFAPDLCVDVH
jgi:hypothetical protein